MSREIEPTWLTIRVSAASPNAAYAILSNFAGLERLRVVMDDQSAYDLVTDSRTGPVHVGTAQIIGGGYSLTLEPAEPTTQP